MSTSRAVASPLGSPPPPATATPLLPSTSQPTAALAVAGAAASNSGKSGGSSSLPTKAAASATVSSTARPLTNSMPTPTATTVHSQSGPNRPADTSSAQSANKAFRAQKASVRPPPTVKKETARPTKAQQRALARKDAPTPLKAILPTPLAPKPDPSLLPPPLPIPHPQSVPALPPPPPTSTAGKSLPLPMLPLMIDVYTVTSQWMADKLSMEDLLRLEREVTHALRLRGLGVPGLPAPPSNVAKRSLAQHPAPKLVPMVPQPLPMSRPPTVVSRPVSIGNKRSIPIRRPHQVRLLPAPLPPAPSNPLLTVKAPITHGKSTSPVPIAPAPAPNNTVPVSTSVTETNVQAVMADISAAIPMEVHDEADMLFRQLVATASCNMDREGVALRGQKRAMPDTATDADIDAAPNGPPARQRPRRSASEHKVPIAPDNDKTLQDNKSEPVASATPLGPSVVPSVSGDPHPPRALPATQPVTTVVDGVEWVEFSYSVKGANRCYRVRADIDDVNIIDMPERFRHDNCLYPRADVPRDEYRGNRWRYETECNNIGWRLAWVNRPVLAGKRGLIQRAVDSYRNRHSDLRSRRVARLEKLSTTTCADNLSSSSSGLSTNAVGDYGEADGKQRKSSLDTISCPAEERDSLLHFALNTVDDRFADVDSVPQMPQRRSSNASTASDVSSASSAVINEMISALTGTDVSLADARFGSDLLVPTPISSSLSDLSLSLVAPSTMAASSGALLSSAGSATITAPVNALPDMSNSSLLAPTPAPMTSTASADSTQTNHPRNARIPKCLVFEAVIKGVATRLRIRVDSKEAEAAVAKVDDEFRRINAVFPRALCPRNQYTGTRWELETRCNELACKLAALNPTRLSGRKALLQRAVDAYRKKFMPDWQPRLGKAALLARTASESDTTHLTPDEEPFDLTAMAALVASQSASPASMHSAPSLAATASPPASTSTALSATEFLSAAVAANQPITLSTASTSALHYLSLPTTPLETSNAALFATPLDMNLPILAHSFAVPPNSTGHTRDQSLSGLGGECAVSGSIMSSSSRSNSTSSIVTHRPLTSEEQLHALLMEDDDDVTDSGHAMMVEQFREAFGTPDSALSAVDFIGALTGESS